MFIRDSRNLDIPRWYDALFHVGHPFARVSSSWGIVACNRRERSDENYVMTFRRLDDNSFAIIRENR